MDIVVVGGGKVGARLAQDLRTEGHNITIIEKNAKIVEKILEVCDIQGLVGSGTDLDIQRTAGVPTCQMFIAVTPLDEINLTAAMMAKQLGAEYTVARVRNPEYFRNWDFMRDAMGVNTMINPEFEAAKSIDNVLNFPSAIEMEEFSSHQAEMIQIKIADESPIVGKELKDLSVGATICSVLRDEKAFIPKGNFKIKAGDALYITGEKENLTNFCKEVGIYKDRVHSLLIIGGGKLSYYLLKLLPKRMDLKVIEIDEAVCERISAEFPHVIVVHGDGTNTQVLDEENISAYDACAMLTGVDEENILLSLYAKQKKVGKIITKVNRQPLLNVVSGQGLQTIITPKVLAVNLLTQIVRSQSNAEGSNIRTFHRIAEEKVEVLEFLVSEDSKIIHIPLKDLDIKDDVIFAYILRGKKLIFPKGNDTIEPGDRVVIATTILFFDDLEDVLN